MCGLSIPDSAEASLCEDCLAAITLDERDRCDRCGLERAPGAGTPSCLRCRKTRLPFQQVVLLGTYAGALREAVVAGKQCRGETLMMSIGRLLARRIDEQVADLPDIVTYVPSHWRRRWSRRGANPASTLASVIGSRLGRPVRSTVRCVRHISKQAMLPAPQRARNVAGAFAMRRGVTIEGASLLVVDDVMTTGATLTEVAGVLRRAGAARVLVTATARGAGKT